MDLSPTDLPVPVSEKIERQARELRRRLVESTNKIEAARERLNASPQGDQRRQAEIELQEADQESKNAVLAQKNAEIRLLSVFEHPLILDRALSESQARLLIVSPWMNPTVVNRELLEKMRRALKRGVQIYIGYGIGQEADPRKQKFDEAAAASLIRLAAEVNGLRLTRLGDTHAKVLAWDSTCLVNTSFNWLSFKGDSSKNYRDERGIAVTNASAVDEMFREYLPRFDS